MGLREVFMFFVLAAVVMIAVLYIVKYQNIAFAHSISGLLDFAGATISDTEMHDKIHGPGITSEESDQTRGPPRY